MTEVLAVYTAVTAFACLVMAMFIGSFDFGYPEWVTIATAGPIFLLSIWMTPHDRT